jgi:hypothetical protein
MFIINLIKKFLSIGRCDACASFSFKLKTRKTDKKKVCNDCLLEIGTDIKF